MKIKTKITVKNIRKKKTIQKAKVIRMKIKMKIKMMKKRRININ